MKKEKAMIRSRRSNKFALDVSTTMHRTFAAAVVCELSTGFDVDAGGWLAPEDRVMDFIDATASLNRKSIILRNADLTDETRQHMASLSEANRGVGPAPDVVIMVFSDLSCLVYAAGRPAAQHESPGGIREPRMMLLDPQPRVFPRSISTPEGKKLFSFSKPSCSGARTGAKSLATKTAQRHQGQGDKMLCLGNPRAWLPFDITPAGHKINRATTRGEQQPTPEQSAYVQSACDAITAAAASIAGAIPDLPAAFLTDASGVRRQGMRPHTPFPPFLGHRSWTHAEKTEVSETLKQIALLHISEGYSFVDGLSDADRDSLSKNTFAVQFISGLDQLAYSAEYINPMVRIQTFSGIGGNKKEQLEIEKKVQATFNADLSAIFDTSIFIGSFFLARVNSSTRFGPSSIVITPFFLAKGQSESADRLSGHQALRLRRRIEEAKTARAMTMRQS